MKVCDHCGQKFEAATVPPATGTERETASAGAPRPSKPRHHGDAPATSSYVKRVESRCDAEAEQGDGPAAACASGAAVDAGQASTSTSSVVVSQHGAAAASDIGVVAVGPTGAAAASEIGVATVGPTGAAATSNAANSSNVVVNKRRKKRLW